MLSRAISSALQTLSGNLEGMVLCVCMYIGMSEFERARKGKMEGRLQAAGSPVYINNI